MTELKEITNFLAPFLIVAAACWFAAAVTAAKAVGA